tara:strand:+ start:4255 stop:5778 length:1524 start_codon:yes stop_codon:yes gene_type:complete
MKDRVIFWFGADFTQFCMSYFFQKKHDASLYSIVDITNSTKKFFQTQKLVHFEKTWYLHDQYDSKKNPDINYLENFEKKYNVDLWKLIINERIFYNFFNFYDYSKNEILSIVEQICRFYEKIFKEISPNFFITKLTAFHHLELFRLMCKYHGTKVLMLSIPKIANKNLISEDSSKVDYVDNISNVQCETKSFEELQEYIKSMNTKNLVENFWNKHGENSKYIKLKSLNKFLFSGNINLKTNYNYYGRTKFNVIKNAIDLTLRKKARQFFIDKNLIRNPNLNSQYIYFPLGVVMERHILIGAPFYTNQVEVIRHLAKSMPMGYTLFLKENPAQSSREWRPISEYKEIMKIPNVKLIHYSFSQEELLKNSALVATITGGSSFEAAFYGKPSVVFGDVIYSYLPSVRKVENLEQLPSLIKESLNSKVDPHHLTQFLKMMNENVINFEFTEFFSEFNEIFLHSGGYLDSDIDENELLSFLKKKSSDLEYLAECHIKKIEQHKNYNKNKIQV